MLTSDKHMIRRIAKKYYHQHSSYTIRQAVAKAFEAYDFVKDAEIETQDEHYERGYE